MGEDKIQDEGTQFKEEQNRNMVTDNTEKLLLQMQQEEIHSKKHTNKFNCRNFYRSGF